jgi:hypothetical protein
LIDYERQFDCSNFTAEHLGSVRGIAAGPGECV